MAESTNDQQTADDEVAGGVDSPRFSKLDGAEYDRVNDLLREYTELTAREWAIARLCQDFRTETGVEMTTIGENLPDLVPFMEDTYSPQSVNSAKDRFDEKVQQAANTFFYGALCGFYSADELEEILYEAREASQFLLEVEGADIDIESGRRLDEEVQQAAPRELHESSRGLRKSLDEEQSDGE